MLTKDELIAFEKRMAARFEAGDIKAPLHLAGGNEAALIDIFRQIRRDDWILCSWRSHYHCLLKGVPEAELEAAIVRGRSIALCFPEYRVLSSAIVGGIAPIAVGLAWAIKRSGGSERVWVFLGDMTAETGIYQEAMKYGAGHGLPIKWVIEDNGLSVCTDTHRAWFDPAAHRAPDVQAYIHKLTWPHVGIGQFVRF